MRKTLIFVPCTRGIEFSYLYSIYNLPLDCPLITINGGTVLGSRHYMANASVVCNNDRYLASNVSTIQCNFGGDWSTPIPSCKSMLCPFNLLMLILFT